MNSNDCTSYQFLKLAPRILPSLEEFAVELHTPPDTKRKLFSALVLRVVQVRNICSTWPVPNTGSPTLGKNISLPCCP